MPFLWYGLPGLEIPRDDEELIRLKAAEYRVLPIFLESGLANKYYNGFGSQFALLFLLRFQTNPSPNAIVDIAYNDNFRTDSTLWPLFHYQLHEMGRIDKIAWEAYVEVSLLFAKVIASIV